MQKWMAMGWVTALLGCGQLQQTSQCTVNATGSFELLEATPSSGSSGGASGVTWSSAGPLPVVGTVLMDSAPPLPPSGTVVGTLRIQDAQGHVFALQHGFSSWVAPAAGTMVTLSAPSAAAAQVDDAQGRTVLFTGNADTPAALNLPSELSVSEKAPACESSGNCGTITFHNASITAQGQSVDVSPGTETTVGNWHVMAVFQHYDSRGTTCPVHPGPVVTFHAFQD